MASWIQAQRVAGRAARRFRIPFHIYENSHASRASSRVYDHGYDVVTSRGASSRAYDVAGWVIVATVAPRTPQLCRHSNRAAPSGPIGEGG